MPGKEPRIIEIKAIPDTPYLISPEKAAAVAKRYAPRIEETRRTAYAHSGDAAWETAEGLLYDSKVEAVMGNLAETTSKLSFALGALSGLKAGGDSAAEALYKQVGTIKDNMSEELRN